MDLAKKNMLMEKSLLVIKGGVIKGQGISKRYYQYKVMITKKFQAEIVKPYILLFPCKLDEKDVNYIEGLLGKDTKYRWFTVINKYE